MSLIVAVFAALAIAFSAAPAATEAPVQVQQVQQVVQHDPILAMDADVTLDDYNATREFSDEKGNHYIAQYGGSDVSSDNMFGEFTYESIDFPGTYHHYTYSILKFA